jgi:hypothetical protein
MPGKSLKSLSLPTYIQPADGILQHHGPILPSPRARCPCVCPATSRLKSMSKIELPVRFQHDKTFAITLLSFTSKACMKSTSIELLFEQCVRDLDSPPAGWESFRCIASHSPCSSCSSCSSSVQDVRHGPGPVRSRSLGMPNARYDAGRSHRLVGVTFLIRESWPDRRRLKSHLQRALLFWISNRTNNTTDVRSKPLPSEVPSYRLIPRTRLKWETCFGHQPCWE